MVSAGKILIRPLGTYDPSTTYQILDMVNYGTCSWICRQTCLNQTPEEGPYWMQIGTTVGLASATDAGLVTIDDTIITLNADGQLTANAATDTNAGVVKYDNEIITLNADGQLTANAATNTTAGVVKYDNETITLNADGQLKVLEGGARTVTKAEFDDIVENRPEERAGKQYAIYDDYETNAYASETEYGYAMISRSENDTDINGKVLASVEKNPEVAGSLASKIKNNTDDISLLNTDLARSSDYLYSPNLIEKLTKANRTIIATNKIESEPNADYTISYIAGNTSYIIQEYNSSDTIINSYGWQNTSPFTFTTNSETVNFTVAFTDATKYETYVSDVVNAQVEKGSSATSYTKYAKSNVELTEEVGKSVSLLNLATIEFDTNVGAFTQYKNLPDGFKKSNTYILSIKSEVSSGSRFGEGMYDTNDRFFVEISSGNQIRVYSSYPSSNHVEVLLLRLS